MNKRPDLMTLPGRTGAKGPIDQTDAELIGRIYDGFPLCDRPFAEVGRALGLTEDEVLERLHRLLATGVLTHLGPLYQIEQVGGAYMLAAIEVPPAQFERIAALVNAHLQVAQNYRRAHRLNMWFVVAAESQQAVADCLRQIAAETGLQVHTFPKEREFRASTRLKAFAPAADEETS